MRGFIRFFQRSWKHYSQWISCHATQFEVCCGCGLVHQVQYRLRDNPRKKNESILYKRVRAARGRTAARRRRLGIKVVINEAKRRGNMS